ncbi:MAG: phage tail tube protein [Aigarchaeota archaeon]|nr:phage tail tube protein [Aigarchaeota archaeon]MDW8093064.1 phage tail tube protein [Nitrososphaerota archaeon]
MNYIGLGKQPSFGTSVDPSKFIEATSYSITPIEERELVETATSRTPLEWYGVKPHSEIEVEALIQPQGGLEYLLLSTFQRHSTTAVDLSLDVYRHEFTPWTGGNLTYFTVEGSYGGTALRARDCIVDSLSFSFSSEELPRISAAMIGNSATIVSRASHSPNLVKPFTNSDVKVEIEGAEVELRELSIEINNNIEDIYDLSSSLVGVGLGLLEVSGELNVRFLNQSHLERFITRDEASLVVRLRGPPIGGDHRYELQISIPRVIYDAWEGEVSGAELTTQSVRFKSVKPTNDETIRVVLVNRTSTL